MKSPETRRALLFGAVILASLWTSNVRLHACSCAVPRPACEATWEAAAVFVGQLLSTVDEKPDPRRDLTTWPSDPSRRFNFKVLEVFRGVSAPQVPVYGERSSSCALTLTQGETYLVYASRLDDGSLYTHMCYRTRRVADAAEDLEYLRGPATLSSGLGSIQGVAREPDLQRPSARFDDEPPFAGARVRVESVDPKRPATYEATTGLDGRYAVKVPVGKYRIALTVRDGLWPAGPYRNMPLEVRDPRGCASADFIVYPDGRIGGRLLDAEARPMPAMNVEVRPVGDRAQSSFRHLYSARTDDSGAFEFRQLFPGDYVVGLTLDTSGERSVWLERDGEPVRSSFEIAAEQRLWIGEVQLPRSLELTTVKGLVLNASGRAAQDAQVRVLEEPGSHEPASTPAGTDGSFTFSLVAGRTYILIAERNFEPGARRKQAKSAPFKAVPGAMSFTLRFDK